MNETAPGTRRRRGGTRERIGYGIGAVSRLTGLSAETLRVWERRYGVPTPSRTAGGARTYDDSEIARLRLVARALAAGHRAGGVVQLSRKALERLVTDVEGMPVDASSDAAPSVLACVQALAAEDAHALRVLLRRAAILLGPGRFVEELARPLAERVGAMWERGEMAVRQEHLLTQCLSTQLRVVLAGLEGAEAAPVVVLATLPGELHSLGLDMVAVQLAARGCTPRLLGPSCPPREIAAAIRGLGADVIGVSVSFGAPLAATLRDLRHLLAATQTDGKPVWIGGQRASSVEIADPRVVVVDSTAALERAIAHARGRLPPA
jgi:DNA-binding transcriptional MerR regulator